MTGSSDEERYSRFRGERQGLTVVVDNTRPREEERPGRSRHREDRAGGRRDQSHSLTVVVDNDRSCTQDQRSRPRQRENRDGSRGHRGALAERRRQERREQRERERYRPYPSQNLTGSRRGRSREQGQGRNWGKFWASAVVTNSSSSACDRGCTPRRRESSCHRLVKFTCCG